MSEIDKLLELMKQLRNPVDGCPWDREQTFGTIAPYTIEEAYEVADAIAREDLAELRGELGDLLFQVVFHSRMAEEQGAFDFDDVVSTICEKMWRRHPHVFGNDEERQRGAVDGSWERIKARERASENLPTASALDGVAVALPALKRAGKLGKRAAAVGFDWPDTGGVERKIAEETRELAAARSRGDPSAVDEELGDLLFAVVNLARHLRIDAEDALTRANRKFEQRFRLMERRLSAAGKAMDELSIDELEAAWQQAKQELAAPC